MPWLVSVVLKAGGTMMVKPPGPVVMLETRRAVMLEAVVAIMMRLESLTVKPVMPFKIPGQSQRCQWKPRPQDQPAQYQLGDPRF